MRRFARRCSRAAEAPQSADRGVVGSPGAFGRPSPAYACREMVDDRDLDIIGALQTDARATYADVAQRVGLSPSSVHERVRKLEQAGVIRGYRATIDPEGVGLLVTALIAVTPLDPRQPDDLPERVEEFAEVEDCYSVAGEANYILKVRARTTGDLEDLIRRLREKAGVNTRTTIVLSTPFEGRPLAPQRARPLAPSRPRPGSP
jgi:Lrp/AsnC family leucine-responsive transcriptional regulator